MNLNPYQASASTDAQVETDPLLGLVEKISSPPLVVLVVLVVASVYHYSLIEDPLLYRKSIQRQSQQWITIQIPVFFAVIKHGLSTEAERATLPSNQCSVRDL